MKTPLFIQIYSPDLSEVSAELRSGLMSLAAHTSPKYLYDALGSRLFEAITELPEYYPTRTEARIFELNIEAMAEQVPQGATLVDLGAGNCAKAASLFAQFLPSRYVAVDISIAFLRNALNSLQRQYPALDMLGVGLDFSTGLVLPPAVVNLKLTPRVLFYPGSSIGNFDPDAALLFLRSVRVSCGTQSGSGLLIGVDLVKNIAEMEAAYDDALGVTAAFNRNLMLHINRIGSTNFQLADWRHVALFNAFESRIEMYLEAARAVTVCWPGGQRAFAVGERIHTENSYKWTLDLFSELLRKAGFNKNIHWTDPEQKFAVFWASIGNC